MGLLDDAAFAFIRDALGITLWHSYTRTPLVPGSVNGHNEATVTPGALVSGLPCRYETKDVVRMIDGNLVTLSTPTLTVPTSDDLAANAHLVSDIRQQPRTGEAEGQILHAGPFVVESIDEQADLGQSIQRVATLRASDVLRAD